MSETKSRADYERQLRTAAAEAAEWIERSRAECACRQSATPPAVCPCESGLVIQHNIEDALHELAVSP